MAKTKEIKIEELRTDDLNANKGTEYGKHLIDKSFREFGAGRSILIDKNNKVIAGNKSAEQCAEIGIEDVIVVETDGTKLVAVKRIDIDLDTKQGRELAIADNATSKANLEWDAEAIKTIQNNWDIAPEDWGVNDLELNSYSDKNKEINAGGISDIMTLSLKFTEEQFNFVRAELSLIAETPEDAILKLLKHGKV